MHRVLCREFSDPEQFELVEQPVPPAGAGEAVVRVEAAAVSYVDGLIARGGYQLRPALPFTPGSAVAGTTPDGRRVAALLVGFGGFASHVVVPEPVLAPVPDGVSADVAASCIESYGTMAFAFRDRVPVRPGEWVVVLGAGGGIGQAAVDQARAAGARVLAVASSADKRAAASAAGAEAVIGYGEDAVGLRDAIRHHTDGGADVVVDPVGGTTSEPALRALRSGGRFCVLGFTSGVVPRLAANLVLLRNRTVVGVDWGEWARARPVQARDLTEDVLRRVGTGELRPPRPLVLPLADAARATRAYAERSAVGKTVLVP